MRLQDVIRRDTRANQPAATAVPVGTLYCVSDEDFIVERSNGTAWEEYSPAASGGGGTPDAHAASHEDGGSDELDVTALGGFPGGSTDFLRADGTFAAPPGGGSVALDDLTDVDAGSPNDGDVLTYDSGSGDWVAAAPSGGGSGWTFVGKASDETKSSNTTMASDSALTFSMLANTKYHIRMQFFVTTDTTAFFKHQMVGPASPTYLRYKRTYGASGGSPQIDYGVTNYPAQQNLGGNNAHYEIELMVQNGTNAGTFALQWAQLVSNASNTTVKGGSWLEYRTVS